MKLSFKLLGSCVIAAQAMAAQAGLNGEIGLTTDYIREGIKTTGGNLTLQAGINANHRWGLYGGLWASNLNYKRHDRFAEWDAYSGWYIPLTNTFAIDASVTQNNFVGDDEDIDYHEFHLRLLAWDALTLGYSKSPHFRNGPFAHQSYELAYTFNIDDWSLEAFMARREYVETNEQYNWGSASKDHYWQFRFGIGRTFKRFHYTLTFDGTSLPRSYNGNLSVNLGISRHFDWF